MSLQHDKKLSGRRWRALRRKVLDRDGWRCVKCGKAGRLEADHIQPLDAGGAPWDLDNLQSLCRRDHIDKTASENASPVPEDVREWQEFIKEVRQ